MESAPAPRTEVGPAPRWSRLVPLLFFAVLCVALVGSGLPPGRMLWGLDFNVFYFWMVISIRIDVDWQCEVRLKRSIGKT